MSKTTERFLKYVSFDTQSREGMETVPSTENQRILAEVLAEELKTLGAADVRVSQNAFVYATIPATTHKQVPVLGLIAHMDTAPAMSGKDIKPRLIKNYSGGDITLNENLNIVMKTTDFPYLNECKGMDLIVTDGTTLLGSDDKAGIAEIMSMAEYLIANPQIPHGTVKIAFTPDEEVGSGAEYFDVEGFGAEVAYTVDGCMLGELEYENFNAASGKVRIQGTSVHPGTAKGKMKNAILIGMEFQGLLPVFENPMYTEGYEGFFHLDGFSGDVENASMDYILRDHDRAKLEFKKQLFEKAAEFINHKYGEGTVTIELKDSYYNMREKMEPYMYLIDIAEESMKALDIVPITLPIRGGTDGARLSFMGLPCPNICTGGYNCHGKYEFISVQAMDKVTELLIDIVKRVEGRCCSHQ